MAGNTPDDAPGALTGPRGTYPDDAECARIDLYGRGVVGLHDARTGLSPRELHRLAAARTLCGRCSVRSQCRQYACQAGLQFGVWGGEVLDWPPRRKSPPPEALSDREFNVFMKTWPPNEE